MVSEAPFLIYGANGYTGVLAAKRAKALGLSVVLAGRSNKEVTALGKELDLPTRVAPLDDHAALVSMLSEVKAVLHCAGPFGATSRPMLEACIAARTHYLDITGEPEVFEAIYAQHERLVSAGIAAIPGVGFDVVPSDCIAAMLKDALPHATSLRIAWRASSFKASPGSAKTMVELMPWGVQVRKNGVLEVLPPGSRIASFPFAEGRPGNAVVVGLGDVSSAYRSKGIPDIECYFGMPDLLLMGMRFSLMLRGALKLAPVQRFLKALITTFVKGPSAEERRRATMQLVGEVRAGDERVAMRMSTPEGYELTAAVALEAARRAARGAVAPGAWSPSGAFGKDFIKGFDGVKIETLEARVRAAQEPVHRSA